MWFEELICSLIWAIRDDNFSPLITKNNIDICHSNYLIYLIINPKQCFYYDKLFVSLNHIMTQRIHLHYYFMIKMVYNIYGSNCHHHSYIYNYFHWYNEYIRHLLLLLYWVNWFHCNHMYGQLLLLYFDDMLFIHFYFCPLLFHHWYYYLTMYQFIFAK